MASNSNNHHTPKAPKPPATKQCLKREQITATSVAPRYGRVQSFKNTKKTPNMGKRTPGTDQGGADELFCEGAVATGGWEGGSCSSRAGDEPVSGSHSLKKKRRV